MLLIVVHVSVAGSHISAARTALARVSSSNPGPVVPPVTSTLPSGNKVAFRCRRGKAMDATNRHVGLGALRSITSAVLVGGSWPPMTMILPSAYITDDP